jgi:hypothetical protein
MVITGKLHFLVDRGRWRTALVEASRRRAQETTDPLSETGRAA